MVFGEAVKMPASDQPVADQSETPESPAVQPETLFPLSSDVPNDVAVRCGNEVLTWAELEDAAIRFANRLIDAGITDGARWAVLARNRIEWPVMMTGNGRAGARYVPLNWHLTAAEIAELLVDSESKMVVSDPEHVERAREAAALAGIDDVRVLGDEFDEWIAGGSATPPTNRPMGSALQYTGGTTGRSKGVTRTDFAGNVERWAPRFAGWGNLTAMPDEGVMMLSTPIYHALGGACVSAGLARRHTVVILERFDPEMVLSTIAEHGVTSAPMVPTQFVRLLKLDDDVKSSYDLSSLQWVLHTAAPCPPWAKRAMIEWFGPVITELYGSSEGTGPVIGRSQEWLERPGTVGRAQGTLTLSIVDDDGNDLPPGEIGTIYAHRPEGPPSYHGAQDKTDASRLPDGRFTVGDVGWLDDDGYLFLADRRVDLILRGGTNVYPAEIEGVLSSHPLVADVAVFGIPDPDMGQSIKAVVELVPGADAPADPGAFTEELRRFAAEQLASFKLPNSVDIADALPREASGKLKKRLLRDPYWP